MEVKDFKVGQTVFVKLIGNAKRGKSEENLIEEWEVTKIGKKYVHARKKGCNTAVKFEKKDYGTYKEQFVEKTDYSEDYILYPSKKELEENLEYEKLSNDISKMFRYGSSEKLSLDQLRKIKAVICESEG